MSDIPADRPTVLAVDDDERNLMLLESILLPMGVQVVMARSGEEALRLAGEAGPDVILLDVMMPGMDGFETARRLKDNPATSFVPIVMVTTLHDVSDRIRALDAGADDFLSKPVDRAELRTRVRTLLQVKAYHDHMRDYQHKLEAEVETKARDLRAAADRIRTASLETIFRLAAAAEYKDEDTGTHIVRMAHYASLLAGQLGLEKSEVEDIRAAAPMHDIGKIGIPDRILLKPGKLAPDEWDIMKRHTSIGAEILAGSDAQTIRLGETIAVTHHEKWDGSGYPGGLRGDAIPLAGRIVAVADVFDALCSKRPYRPQPFFPPELVFRMIQEGSGTQFDPQVVEAFLSVQGEVLDIKNRFGDNQESRMLRLAGQAAAPAGQG